MNINPQVFISRIQDNNIFHILYNLIMYYDASYSMIYMYYDESHRDISNINSSCQKWRKFLLERIFRTDVKYTNKLLVYNQPKRSPFSHNRYIKYDKDPILLQMLKNVIPAENGKYILMNQRKENARAFLLDNPDLANDIETKIRAHFVPVEVDPALGGTIQLQSAITSLPNLFSC